ncbi:MAG: DUF2306 domain-containing protein [Planctomycetales bacterium]|nr:DUF2306 domain-containing protein [Planctomycetales bacterium]
MFAATRHRQLNRLNKLALFALGLLAFKTFAAVLWEYRWYFPPDFESSAFLVGRKTSFVGPYRVAFYVHLVSGPVTLILAAVLVFTGSAMRGRRSLGRLHRAAGRWQVVVVLFALAPSGLIMSRQALAGPVAGVGFASLAILTALYAAMAWRRAAQRRHSAHRHWALGCTVLLVSPLLLRIVGGVFVTLQIESPWSYRINAWLSWLIPLFVYEAIGKGWNDELETTKRIHTVDSCIHTG